MSRADIIKLVKKLKRYSKDQIIDALSNQFNADYYIRGLLNHLEEQESDKLLKEHHEAIEAEARARKMFSDFLGEMCAKYGNGNTFKINALSPAEYARGAVLEEAIKAAEKKERMLDKKVTKMLKLEDYE